MEGGSVDHSRVVVSLCTVTVCWGWSVVCIVFFGFELPCFRHNNLLSGNCYCSSSVVLYFVRTF